MHSGAIGVHDENLVAVTTAVRGEGDRPGIRATKVASSRKKGCSLDCAGSSRRQWEQISPSSHHRKFCGTRCVSYQATTNHMFDSACDKARRDHSQEEQALMESSMTGQKRA